MSLEGLNDFLAKYETAFNDADAASRDVLPPGEYAASINRGEWVKTASGKDSFRLTYKVESGEFVGRLFFHSLYLSPAALPYTKADLATLGITSLAALKDFPADAYRVKAKLVIRKGDGGDQWNRVQSMELVEFRPPQPDTFAPTKEGGA